MAVLGTIGAAVYRSRIADALPAGISADAPRGALETVAGAVTAVQQLPADQADYLVR
jgi:DHA2 family multidrug resistance protein-like MFS transporter